MALLTDADILEALGPNHSWSSGAPTYVIRNVIAGRAHAAGDKDKARAIRTSHVRSRLYRLEREGRVIRVPTNYSIMICWALPAATA